MATQQSPATSRNNERAGDLQAQARELGMRVEPGTREGVIAKIGPQTPLAEQRVGGAPGSVLPDIRELAQRVGSLLSLSSQGASHQNGASVGARISSPAGEFRQVSADAAVKIEQARAQGPQISTPQGTFVQNSATTAVGTAQMTGAVTQAIFGPGLSPQVAPAAAPAASQAPGFFSRLRSALAPHLALLSAQVRGLLPEVMDLARETVSHTVAALSKVPEVARAIGSASYAVGKTGLQVLGQVVAPVASAVTGMARWGFNATLVGDLWRIPRAISEKDTADLSKRLKDLGKLAVMGVVALGLPALGPGAAIGFGALLAAGALDTLLGRPKYEREHAQRRGEHLRKVAETALDPFVKGVGEEAARSALPKLKNLQPFSAAIDREVGKLVNGRSGRSADENFKAAQKVGEELAEKLTKSKEWADLMSGIEGEVNRRLTQAKRSELVQAIGDKKAAQHLERALKGDKDYGNFAARAPKLIHESANSVLSQEIAKLVAPIVNVAMVNRGLVDPKLTQTLTTGIVTQLSVDIRDA